MFKNVCINAERVYKDYEHLLYEVRTYSNFLLQECNNYYSYSNKEFTVHFHEKPDSRVWEKVTISYYGPNSKHAEWILFDGERHSLDNTRFCVTFEKGKLILERLNSL